MEAVKKEQGDKLYRRYSALKDIFTVEDMIELTRITLMSCSNNEKTVQIRSYLKERGMIYDGLGPGTNRYTVGIKSNLGLGMAIVKFALDNDGMVDNQQEFLYAPAIYPAVTKTYECIPNGLLLVCEYVRPMDVDDFKRFEPEIRKILEKLSKFFFIGDVGVSLMNYKNWGIRSVCGKEYPVILDFAYIFKVNYKLFTCKCDNISLIQYDENYVDLRCPTCGRKYTFADIRRKITRKQREAEIGDLREQGYVLHSAVEYLPIDPRFSKAENREKEKKIKKVPKWKLLEQQQDRLLKQENEDPNREAVLEYFKKLNK